MKKSQWSEIYRSFQSLYPNLIKNAIGYCPYGYATILVYFSDGLRMAYSDAEQRVKFVTI